MDRVRGGFRGAAAWLGSLAVSVIAAGTFLGGTVAPAVGGVVASVAPVAVAVTATAFASYLFWSPKPKRLAKEVVSNVVEKGKEAAEKVEQGASDLLFVPVVRFNDAADLLAERAKDAWVLYNKCCNDFVQVVVDPSKAAFLDTFKVMKKQSKKELGEAVQALHEAGRFAEVGYYKTALLAMKYRKTMSANWLAAKKSVSEAANYVTDTTKAAATTVAETTLEGVDWVSTVFGKHVSPTIWKLMLKINDNKKRVAFSVALVIMLVGWYKAKRAGGKIRSKQFLPHMKNGVPVIPEVLPESLGRSGGAAVTLLGVGGALATGIKVATFVSTLGAFSSSIGQARAVYKKFLEQSEKPENKGKPMWEMVPWEDLLDEGLVMAWALAITFYVCKKDLEVASHSSIFPNIFNLFGKTEEEEVDEERRKAKAKCDPVALAFEKHHKQALTEVDVSRSLSIDSARDKIKKDRAVSFLWDKEDVARSDIPDPDSTAPEDVALKTKIVEQSLLDRGFSRRDTDNVLRQPSLIDTQYRQNYGIFTATSVAQAELAQMAEILEERFDVSPIKKESLPSVVETALQKWKRAVAVCSSKINHWRGLSFEDRKKSLKDAIFQKTRLESLLEAGPNYPIEITETEGTLEIVYEGGDNKGKTKHGRGRVKRIKHVSHTSKGPSHGAAGMKTWYEDDEDEEFHRLQGPEEEEEDWDGDLDDGPGDEGGNHRGRRAERRHRNLVPGPVKGDSVLPEGCAVATKKTGNPNALHVCVKHSRPHAIREDCVGYWEDVGYAIMQQKDPKDFVVESKGVIPTVAPAPRPAPITQILTGADSTPAQKLQAKVEADWVKRTGWLVTAENFRPQGCHLCKGQHPYLKCPKYCVRHAMNQRLMTGLKLVNGRSVETCGWLGHSESHCTLGHKTKGEALHGGAQVPVQASERWVRRVGVLIPNADSTVAAEFVQLGCGLDMGDCIVTMKHVVEACDEQYPGREIVMDTLEGGMMSITKAKEQRQEGDVLCMARPAGPTRQVKVAPVVVGAPVTMWAYAGAKKGLHYSAGHVVAYDKSDHLAEYTSATQPGDSGGMVISGADGNSFPCGIHQGEFRPGTRQAGKNAFSDLELVNVWRRSRAAEPKN